MSERPENPQVVVTDEEIFEAHVTGKLSVQLNAPLDTQRARSIARTQGVAQVSRAIAADHTLAARYPWADRLASADLAPDRIVPSPLDPRVGPAVATAAAEI